MNTTTGVCALCLTTGPLVEGHLFPRFYFKRMRSEGAGLIRRAVDPNVPHQDGPKEYFLCAGCEGKFNKRETVFARKFFHPWMDSRRYPDESTLDTHYFLISLLWRGLRSYMRSPGPEAHIWIDRLTAVQEDWRQYLNGETHIPACDQVHMFLLDLAEPGPQPVLNLNRYMTTVCDCTVAVSTTSCFVYMKMGMFLVIGWVEGFAADLWVNTHIAAATAPFVMPQTIRDGEVGSFMTDRARGAREKYHARISPQQQTKAAARATKVVDKIVNGIVGQALRADLQTIIDPTIGRSTQIEPNEKCPCGSGKVYKQCHGRSGASA